MNGVLTMHPGAEPAESPLTPESWGKLGGISLTAFMTFLLI